jgi:hypothetical protein
MSPGRPSGEDGRGQSNVLGYLLLIAIIAGGTSLVVVFGADALGQTNSQSELKRAEQTMTLFDSRAAMVALGTSDVQSLQVKQQSGGFETRPDEGKLWIRHVAYDTTNSEIIYEQPLGSVVYENGDTRVAYQGGGVWRLDARGAAQMVSPPEFHYRGQTLTLPIIQVQGESSASGSPTVTVAANEQAVKVYPNSSTSYGGITRDYRNPIEKGTVRVFVQSPYYQGWAEYFSKRTSGTVTVYDSNRTARLTLVSLGGAPGQFPIPDEGVAQPIGGVAEKHPLEQFDLELNPDNNFNGESHWSMYAAEDGKEMEIHVEMDNGGGCRDAKIAFYFKSPSEYQEWESPWLSPGGTSAYDCDPATEELSFDLTATDVDMTYEDVSVSGQASGKWCFDVNQDSPSSTTIDAHGVDTGADDGKYDPGSIGTGHTETLNWTTSHYISRMGSKYDLRVQDSQGSAPPACDAQTNGNGGSNMIDEGQSVGYLDYAEAGGAQYITFLHVTENEIEVDFD